MVEDAYGYCEHAVGWGVPSSNERWIIWVLNRLVLMSEPQNEYVADAAPRELITGVSDHPGHRLASYFVWPALLLGAVFFTSLGMQTDYPLLAFYGVYVVFALTIGGIERLLPHERTWLQDDHQSGANIAHTLLNKGALPMLAVIGVIFGLAETEQAADVVADGIWPSEWPMVAQVALAMVGAEFGLYWAHRTAHEIQFVWRFHAVHHSVTRLWFLNTGRFHLVDSFWSVLFSQPILFLMGAPADVILMFGAITAFIGMLTHCNIECRTGVLDYVFNTPQMHRWHHSKDLREGNTNYGENLMLWDQVFGTYFNEPRRPPADIGIQTFMPPTFVGQMVHPFRKEQGVADPMVSVAGEEAS